MLKPSRISAIALLLEKVWGEHPEQRFGQFLYSLIGTRDMFFLLDDELLELLTSRYVGEPCHMCCEPGRECGCDAFCECPCGKEALKTSKIFT